MTSGKMEYVVELDIDIENEEDQWKMTCKGLDVSKAGADFDEVKEEFDTAVEEALQQKMSG